MDKRLSFQLTSQQIKYRDILDKKFLELEMYAISDIDPNRNKVHFTPASMELALPGMKNVPILGFFNQGDFEQHNGRQAVDLEMEKTYWEHDNGEQILGLVRESDPVEIVEKDGLKWVYLRCALWVQYCYKQVKRLLKDKHKKVSVEITVIKSHIRPDGIEEIEEFVLNGITILGSKNGKEILEGIQGAHLNVLQSIEENFQEQTKMLSFAYSQKDEAEGVINKQTEIKEVNPSVEDIKDVTPIEGDPNVAVTEEPIPAPVAEEPVVIVEGEQTVQEISTILEEPVIEGEEPQEPVAEPDPVNDEPVVEGDDDKAIKEEGNELVPVVEGTEPVTEPEPAPVVEEPASVISAEELELLKAELAEATAKIKADADLIVELNKAIEDAHKECEELKCACADYAAIKARMETAEAKVWEHFCNDMAKYACDKMCDEMITSEDKAIIETNCKEGKYSTKEEIDRDIAYAVYKHRPVASKKFSAPILAADTTNHFESQLSREERIAARNGKK